MSKLYTPFELFGIEVDKGWWPLVEPIFNRIKELNEAGAHIEIDQVKEKWGELCVCVSGAPDEIHDMIREAEKKSVHICEHCGKPAERVINEHSWIYTLCPDCLKERDIKVSGTVDESNRRIEEAGECSLSTRTVQIRKTP